MDTTLIKHRWNTYDKDLPRSMRAWARTITSYAEVPEGFQAYFPEPTGTFPYTLLLPPETVSPFQKRHAQLVCLHEDSLVMFEAKRNEVTTTTLPLHTITYVEHGKVLLSSWMTIYTDTDSRTLRYNTVNEGLFFPLLTRIRHAIAPGATEQSVNEAEHQQERAKFEQLQMRNFKYMNYGAQSLLPGDTISSMLYQPDICVKTVKFLKRTLFQQHLTCHLSILTNRELIVIREAKRLKTRQDSMYGGIFTYIPLGRIHEISFAPAVTTPRCQMAITLSAQIALRSEFSVDNPELGTFQHAWNMTAKAA